MISTPVAGCTGYILHGHVLCFKHSRRQSEVCWAQAAAEAALADVALRGEHMSRSSQGGAQGVAGVMAAVGHEIADEMRCAHPPQAARGIGFNLRPTQQPQCA